MEKVIGVDLGGTTIYGGLIDRHGDITRRSSRRTGLGHDREGVLQLIREVIEDLMYDGVKGIAVGSPGCIDSDLGKVLGIGGNIKGWANTDIKGELSKYFPEKPIFIDNDANMAALCEYWIGAGKKYKSFIMLTLGTGVGGAIITEKDGILKGHHFQGGELGHAILYPKGEQCNCGQQGCVDRYISGKSLERSYKRITGIEKEGVDIFRSINDNEICREIVTEYCENLAIYLVSLKNIFDSEVIVIGGGVINSKEYWWNEMMMFYRKYTNDPNGMKIVPAEYLNDAGMIGAGKIVFDNMDTLHKLQSELAD